LDCPLDLRPVFKRRKKKRGERGHMSIWGLYCLQESRNSFSVATLRTDLLQLKVKKLMVRGWVLDTIFLKP
jgi:hypothetical protein